MWWAVAAAAAPYVIAALQKKPHRPGAPAPIPLQNRDPQIDQMMDTAFNPNSQTYNLASQHAMENVNRALGRQGMGGSSVGAQLHQGTQSKLAQAWLQEQAQRQQSAMQIAQEYDRNQAGWQAQQNDAQYKYAMDAYGEANKRNANQVAGVSNMINAGVGAYNQGQMMDRYDHMIGYNQKPVVYDYSNQPMQISPSYGAPGPSSYPLDNNPYSPGGAYAPVGAYTQYPVE